MGDTQGASKQQAEEGSAMKAVPKPTIFIDLPRREWIRAQACAICPSGKQSSPTECAHVHTKRNAGDDHNLVPLCKAHHAEQHRVGVQTFATQHGVDLEARAVAYWARYDKEMGW